MTGSGVRELCLSLPETTEKETWGDAETPGHPTFRVRDRIMAEQAELMSAFPDAARSASHVGRFGWVDLDFGGVPDEVLREVITGAWERTAPKRVVSAWRGQA
jgi:hypothetical protein